MRQADDCLAGPREELQPCTRVSVPFALSLPHSRSFRLYAMPNPPLTRPPRFLLANDCPEFFLSNYRNSEATCTSQFTRRLPTAHKLGMDQAFGIRDLLSLNNLPTQSLDQWVQTRDSWPIPNSTREGESMVFDTFREARLKNMLTS